MRSAAWAARAGPEAEPEAALYADGLREAAADLAALAGWDGAGAWWYGPEAVVGGNERYNLGQLAECVRRHLGRLEGRVRAAAVRPGEEAGGRGEGAERELAELERELRGVG